MARRRARIALAAGAAIVSLSAYGTAKLVGIMAPVITVTPPLASAPAPTVATPLDCSVAGDLTFCDGFDPLPSVMPGTTPAVLGDPSTVAFNGLGLIVDTLNHAPKHAVPTRWTAPPAPLASPTMPSIPSVTVLNRRDALIVYVPAVKGAADYRAYIVDSSVTFAGTQPRGATVACAGFRQRYGRNVDALLSGSPVVSAVHHRELLQAIEVPGLVTNGDYKIVVEALASPCPFPGVMGHTDATIPLSTVNASSSGGDHFNFRSFANIKTMYGNEILNGQGSTLLDYKNVNAAHEAPVELIGQPVPPNDAVMPADPLVLARSTLKVSRPAGDEAVNGPIFDVGPNATFDDFSSDAVMTTLHTETRSEGAGLVSGGQFGDWYFWTIAVQPALDALSHWEDGNNPKGVQVWRRHGRLYTTFGDWGQDVLGAIYFSSTKTQPQQLDTTKYVHSFFRVDSGATPRRYWHWMMCGGATRDELADPVTHIPRGRPVAQPFFYEAQGRNPSAPMLGEPNNAYHDKECLNLIQLGGYWNWGPPPNAGATWYDEPHSHLQAFISPQGVENGIINLKPAGIDDYDPDATGGMFWRLDANHHPTSPMFEPFDQQAPLTHFDVFARHDRVVLYINGRQAWCGNLSDRPLAMNYGLITYGNVLYHSSAETSAAYTGVEGGYEGAVGASFHYVMNTPWADTRIWDAVGHSEKIDIPPQFTFDAGACFKPKSTAVQ
ncbi:MAG: hypothetical protein ABIO49_05235 [Dokdonella sp.]